MTYRDLLHWGEDILSRAAIPDAKADAWYLMEAVAGFSRSQYLLRMSEEAGIQLEDRYRSLAGQRAARIPLQHLLGEAWFYGNRFMVNGDVLIPRQETELLVEEASAFLETYKAADEDPVRVLDLCTGSGCIGITLALLHSAVCVTGSDISGAALNVARENAKRLQAETAFVQSDLFERLDGKYSLIVSNPPYIASECIDDLAPEVAQHDPRLALDGGPDGLAVYRRIISEAPSHLVKGGGLFMEIGFDQGNPTAELLSESGFSHIRIVKDLAGLDRVVCARRD